MQQAAQDSMDTSPARPTASFEPETLKASPVEAAPAVDPIQVDFVQVEAGLLEEAPEVGSSPSTEELPAPKALNEPPGTIHFFNLRVKGVFLEIHYGNRRGFNVANCVKTSKWLLLQLKI